MVHQLLGCILLRASLSWHAVVVTQAAYKSELLPSHCSSLSQQAMAAGRDIKFKVKLLDQSVQELELDASVSVCAGFQMHSESA